jgi:hypothetical protein
MKQLSCDQCRARWDELINKSTLEADSQFADVHAHLESCADCQKIFELLIASRQELQQFPAQKASASLRANVLAQIEKPMKRNFPWWHSFFVSPQRLAWASGAIMAIFIVALLMRPERQTQIMHSEQKVLSNRGQVEQHNTMQSQLPVASSSSENKSVMQKTAPKNPKVDSPLNLPGHKEKPKKTTLLKSAQKSKHQQKPIASASKSTPKTSQNISVPPKMQTPQNHGLGKPVGPHAELFVPPAPTSNTSTENETSPNEAAGLAKMYAQDSTNQQDSMNGSMAQGARGPEGQAGSVQSFKSQNASAIIHWSKTIISDYEVTSAKIVLTLEGELMFADESPNKTERILWQGTLFRGKKIPLNIDLHRVSNGTAKVHLKMINADTQKVLLDKTFDVK